MSVEGNGGDTRVREDGNAEALARVHQHQAAGRFAEAGALLDTLLHDRPDDPDLLHNKAINLFETGAADAGRDLMERLVNAPGHRPHPAQLMDYGVILAKNGEIEKAAEQFQLAVDDAPNFAMARSNLGMAQLALGKPEAAIANLVEAARQEPNMIEVNDNLASAYLQTNRYDKAIETLYKSLATDPHSHRTHAQLSGALLRRDRFDAAEHHARKANELRPKDPTGYLHLGNALAAAGKMNEAAEALRKAVNNPVIGVAALSRLIHLRKIEPGAPELDWMEKRLAHIDRLPPEPQAALHFAAGKAFDDLKDFDRAFSHFRRGNEITGAQVSFDLAAVTARSDRLLDFCSPALLARCAGGARNEVAPIFICGLPRSGTTLMEQMFSRHPDVQAGGELSVAPGALQKNMRLREALGEELDEREIGTDDFNRLGEDVIAHLHREGLRAEYVTDKMPANYRNIGLLSLALPRAKFLIMRRHPLDCLLSNYMQNFGQNQPFSCDFGNLAGIYREFDKMARAWAQRLPDQVSEVSYEAVTADTEAEMRKCLAFAGLDWTPDILDHQRATRQVSTASVAQVREPIYTKSVARWRNFGAHLAPLAEGLRAFLTAEELAACGVDGA